MVELEQYKFTVNQYKEPMKELGLSLSLSHKHEQIKELESEMREEGFWNNPDKAQEVTKKLKNLKDTVSAYHALEMTLDDVSTMIELGNEENDASVIPEIEELLGEFEIEFDNLKIQTLLSGEYDKNNAIVTLHAGAGGTESCDWAGMLYRMYSKWADSHGFKTEVLDYLDGDEAGIKSITFEVNGENAYGYLKSEKGVHRLVRISPFNAAGKRQTSFASCDVMPDIEEDLSVEIADEDIRIDTYRSSGAGGQHINKTDSAIRITHIPTGVVVQCQNERSQHKNKDKAMKILRSRIYDVMEEQRHKEIADERKSQVGSGDRSERIRTYNFPQSRVTDHRINLTLYKLEQILDGNLDEIIDALVTADQAAKLAGQND